MIIKQIAVFCSWNIRTNNAFGTGQYEVFKKINELEKYEVTFFLADKNQYFKGVKNKYIKLNRFISYILRIYKILFHKCYVRIPYYSNLNLKDQIMRPYGREQLESLYFEYPKFRAPKFNKNKEEAVDVTIVGAGPIGLTAALTLAKYGVSSVILEAKDTFNDGSRAICIARQSFHIFDTLGVINQFTKKALGWTKGRSFYRGKQILEFDMISGWDYWI